MTPPPSFVTQQVPPLLISCLHQYVQPKPSAHQFHMNESLRHVGRSANGQKRCPGLFLSSLFPESLLLLKKIYIFMYENQRRRSFGLRCRQTEICRRFTTIFQIQRRPDLGLGHQATLDNSSTSRKNCNLNSQ